MPRSAPTQLYFFCLLLLISAGSQADYSPMPEAYPPHAVVLLYHHVAEDTPAITSISPTMFKQQMHYLRDRDFKVWPLTKIIDHITNNKPMPDKVIGISFDDNYQSVHDTAFPLLKDLAFPFTVFVSTDPVEGGYNMQASWEQMQAMSKHGGTISNHSASHAHLLRKSLGESEAAWRKRVTADIEKAQRLLANKLGSANHLFAYPYGETNTGLSALVKEMGLLAFGQHSGAIGATSDQFNLPRFPFAGRYTDINDFALKVHSLAMPLADVTAEDLPLDYSQNKPGLTLHFKAGHGLKNKLQCFGSGQGALNIVWKTDDSALITPKEAIPIGRSRYNCTAQATKIPSDTSPETRFHWYSHAWLRLGQNGQWPAE